jgi:predicted dehydrogenase
MDSLMLEDFITGARNGSPAGATAVDGLRTLEVVLAAYRSSHTRQPERVECNKESEKA